MNDTLSQIGVYLDGCATPQEEEALFEAVADQPEVADQLIACALLAGDLREIGSTQQPLDEAPPRRMPAARSRRGRLVRATAAAAVVLLAVTLGWMFTPDSQTQPAEEPIVDAAPSWSIGSVVHVAGEMFASQPLVAGRPIGSDPIRIGDGELGLILNSGTSVDVAFDSEFAVRGAMDVRLMRGVATFDCPPSARGFTVHLPGGGRIVDLGTRFAVQVDDKGRSEVWVYEGAVELVTDAGRTRLDAGGVRAMIDGRVRPLNESFADESSTAAQSYVRFDPDRIEGYPIQDARAKTTSHFDVFEQGRTLRLVGNAWKTLPLAYQVKPETVIELEFRSMRPGEIHAIGFDRRANDPPRFGLIKLAGEEVDPSFPLLDQFVAPRRWTKLTVPIGQYYTGSFERLLIVSDDDADSDAEGWFRNVRIYETPNPKENQP